MKPSFAKVADRIKGMLHNHPRSQYVRLTRAEAEAVVAAAPPEPLGSDLSGDTRKVLTSYLRATLGFTSGTADHISRQVLDFLTTDNFRRRELERRLEEIDRNLDFLASWAAAERIDLRRGHLPRSDGGFTQLDQAWSGFHRDVAWVRATVESVIATHYTFDRIKPESTS